MASIKPLGQRVLVKRLDAEEVSAGGIVLPDTAQEKPQEAEVVALGTGGKDENGNDITFNVEEGNKVLKTAANQCQTAFGRVQTMHQWVMEVMLVPTQ